VRAEGVRDLDLAGAVILTDTPALLDESAQARIRQDAVPHAQALLELGSARLARGISTDPAELAPLYLRPFAASERKR